MQNERYDDEITLKELILIVKDYFFELLRKWWLIIPLVGLIGAYMLYGAYQKKITYTATLTFSLTEDSGGGGLSSMLGGILPGGFGLGKNNVNLEKILELMNSRKIIQNVLFRKVTINGKEDYFANHWIDIYEIHDRWRKIDDPIIRKELDGFYFTRDSITAFDRTENRVLQNFHKGIILKSLAGSVSDNGTIIISFKSISDEFSLLFISNTFEVLSEHYKNKTIGQHQQTFNLMKSRADSIKRAMNSLGYGIASSSDNDLGSFGLMPRVSNKHRQRDYQILVMMYGEVMKNVEVSRYQLQSATPFIEVIDAPLFPLEPEKASKLKALIIGGFIGGFIGAFIVIGWKVIRDALKEDESKPTLSA